MSFQKIHDDITRMRVRSRYPELEAYIDSHYVEEADAWDESAGDCRKAQPAERKERSFCLKAPRKAAGRAVAREEIEQEESVSFSCSAPKPLAKASAPMADEAAVAPNEADYDTFIEESEAAIKERIAHLSDTFQEYLFYLIETKGLTNADVYKRALLTKQLFSKIKLNPEYHPDKATAMRLCIGVKLNLDETKDLLARAGYALSPCEKRDVIFSYFIEKGVYDMIEIDIALEEHGAECFIE